MNYFILRVIVEVILRLALVWAGVSLLQATDALMAVKWLAVALLAAWMADWDGLKLNWPMER